jgi:hypothetical protein
MAKFGLYDASKGIRPIQAAEADYMVHQDEYVSLFNKTQKPLSEKDELIAVFRLDKGSSVRKIGSPTSA